MVQLNLTPPGVGVFLPPLGVDGRLLCRVFKSTVDRALSEYGTRPPAK